MSSWRWAHYVNWLFVARRRPWGLGWWFCGRWLRWPIFSGSAHYLVKHWLVGYRSYLPPATQRIFQGGADSKETADLASLAEDDPW